MDLLEMQLQYIVIALRNCKLAHGAMQNVHDGKYVPVYICAGRRSKVNALKRLARNRLQSCDCTIKPQF